ncbi:MAG: hypothetical protein WCP16_01355 [Pseudanabaena sp. ELA645]
MALESVQSWVQNPCFNIKLYPILSRSLTYTALCAEMKSKKFKVLLFQGQNYQAIATPVCVAIA